MTIARLDTIILFGMMTLTALLLGYVVFEVFRQS